MQAGMRRYPAPKFPRQHLQKPGREADLKLAPMYEAPAYRGSEKLRDMVALVTGGDSGIGRAVAVLFAREGADVAIAYLNEHRDAAETKRAVEKEGRRCITMSGDVADPRFCKSAVRKTVDVFGKLDILVNNAAFQEHVNKLEDLSDEHFDLTLKTNLYGYFYMARAAVPLMKKGGSIVMNGSVTGLLGSKNLLDYSMTKGGIHAFARSLSMQLVDRGIRVNVVAPGPVWTPLNPADKSAKAVQKFGADTPKAPGPTRGNCTGLCFPRSALLLELYHGRSAAHHRWLFGLLARLIPCIEKLSLKNRADQGSVLFLRRFSKSVVLELWHTLQGVLGRPIEDSVVGIPLIFGGS
jgi:NAD(P)-dependent dehydrogenase (short-subunit alcohol dehydrogenase family)